MPALSNWLAPEPRAAADRRILLAALLIALLNGLVFTFVVPPWQHYDEPNHFEYAWLIANRWRLPQPGDYDDGMRRLVYRSLRDSGFFRGREAWQKTLKEQSPRWIGDYSQLTNPPLYYMLVSLPLAALRAQRIEWQMYAGRLVSVCLYLLVVVAAWGAAQELVPQGGKAGHPLHWLLPGGAALLPGLADAMSAVSSDAGGIVLASLSFWVALRLLRRGISPGALAAGLALAGLTLFMRETAYFSLGFLPLAVMIRWLRRRPRLGWGIAAGVAGLLLLAAIGPGDPASWHRSGAQPAGLRAIDSAAVDGSAILALDGGAPVTPDWAPPVFQPLAGIDPAALSGKTLTLGVWMWASQPVRAFTPALGIRQQLWREPVELTTRPVFYVITAILPALANSRMWVSLEPFAPGRRQSAQVYYDGMVLAEGGFPAGTMPTPDGPGGESGEWGGTAYRNLLRNPSFETGGLRVRPWLDDFGARLLPDQMRPSLLLSFLFDTPSLGWYYQLSLASLLRGFWGTFGWGQVLLLGEAPYRPLVAASALGLLGSLLWLGRAAFTRSRRLDSGVGLLVGFALAAAWGMTLARGANQLGVQQFYLPAARYAYPAILPTLLVFLFGLLTVLRWLLAGVKPPLRVRLAAGLPLAALGGLMIFGWLSIVANFLR